MRIEVSLCYFFLQCQITITFGEDATIYVPILNDTFAEDDFDLPSDLNETAILRYGHHKTHDCPDFKKAYVCIMKCLELGYHIAQSNKKCKCICFKDYVKGKYFGDVKKGWKVPTTSLPPWAKKSEEDDLERLKAQYEEEYEMPNVTETTDSPNTTLTAVGTEITSESDGTGDGVSNSDTTNESGSNEHKSSNEEAESEGEDGDGEGGDGEGGNGEGGDGEGGEEGGDEAEAGEGEGEGGEEGE